MNLFKWQWIDKSGYMKRMHLIPRNKYFNLYLHKYYASDRRDHGLHDHPWDSLSIRIWGPILYERTPHSHIKIVPIIKWRWAKYTHAVIVPLSNTRTYTLFFTGRNKRVWGFHTKDGWKPFDNIK